MNNTVDAESVFRFLVIHGMTANQAGSGFNHFIIAATQNVMQHSHVKMFGGEHHNIQSSKRFTTHRIDVGN